MDIQSTKIELIKNLLNVEKESILIKIKDILLNSEKEEITDYIIDGKPLTVNELQSELKGAEKEIENGDFFTSEELDKEIASWSK